MVLSKHIDFLSLTETWLSASDTSACLADICRYGFCLYHHPRHSGRGDGVAFLVPETYKVEIINTPEYQSFEVICIVIKHPSTSANFICIYRPRGSTNNLFDEFPDFLKTTLQFQEALYMLGYFNIHLDLPSLNTRSFMDVLQTYALPQHVSFPTHVHCHWLDLFITRSPCISIKAIFPTDGLSDHHCVITDL